MSIIILAFYGAIDLACRCAGLCPTQTSISRVPIGTVAGPKRADRMRFSRRKNDHRDEKSI